MRYRQNVMLHDGVAEAPREHRHLACQRLYTLIMPDIQLPSTFPDLPKAFAL